MKRGKQETRPGQYLSQHNQTSTRPPVAERSLSRVAFEPLINPENGNRRDGGWQQQRRARDGSQVSLLPRGSGGDGYYPIAPNPNENSRQFEQETQPIGDRIEVPAQPQPSPGRQGFEYEDRTQYGFSS